MRGLLDATRRDAPASWLGVLAGILPFILFGPLAVLLAYPYPPSAWRTSPPAATLINLLYVMPLVLGFAAGWARRWPAWSFSYLGPALLFPGVLAANAISTPLHAAAGRWTLLEGPLIVAVFGLLVAAVLLLIRHSASWRPMGEAVARDWTRLSFSFFLGAAFFFGQIDHDEDRYLTAGLLLTTLVLVAGAAAYLRGRTQATRIWAMLAALGLALTIGFVRGKFYYVVYAPMLVAIVFVPAILHQAWSERRPAHPT